MDVRFGALVLPVEGYAAVSTPAGAPPPRLHGPPHAPFVAQCRTAGERRLPVWDRGLLYPRFGFVTCQRGTEWRVSLYNTRRLPPVPEGALRAGSLSDVPAPATMPPRGAWRHCSTGGGSSTRCVPSWRAGPRGCASRRRRSSPPWRRCAAAFCFRTTATCCNWPSEYERFDDLPEERRGADRGLWEVAAAWFPGGGTRVLAEPFAHRLDDY